MPCSCNIIPDDVLGRLAEELNLSAAERENVRRTLVIDKDMRALRRANIALSANAGIAIAESIAPIAKTPSIKLFNCQHGTILPGAPVTNPGKSTDQTVKRTYRDTMGVARMLRSVFKRNSLDGMGMDLISSVHYGVNYNNAFWNGQQMTYGDGDNSIFLDFTRSNDVIAHELGHGLTQFSSQFVYANESGGLNESMSDVLGSLFRQWQAKQNVTAADWLIGKDIIGPAAKAQGYKCLRDLANPAASHALAPQPKHFSQYTPGMDPHYSSGIPNHAFYLAAMAIGGRSWMKAGKIWLHALTTHGASPQLTMKQFADRTRTAAQSLFPAKPAVATAVDVAWSTVGL